MLAAASTLDPEEEPAPGEEPRAEQALLDVLDACNGSIGDAATYLGGSTGQLSKVLTKDMRLKDAANAIRRNFDLGPLRSRK